MKNYEILRKATPRQMAQVFHELRVTTFQQAYKPFGIPFELTKEEIDRDIEEVYNSLMSEYVLSKEE